MSGSMEKSAMRPDDVLYQVELIQNVMRQTMREGEHYGTIPGTPHPTLLQPGADKLLLTFRLGPDFIILDKIEKPDFISYTLRCDLIHIPTQNKVGSGMGSCNSRESKYRFRQQNTGRPVPQEYWQTKNPQALGGPQFKIKKIDGQWMITEQVENDNPWDMANTLLKMACKRAKVAATLNATAAHDIFTQDLEDMSPQARQQPNKIKDQQRPQCQQQPPKQQAPRQQAPRNQTKPQGKAQEETGGDLATLAQIWAIQSICKKHKFDPLDYASQIVKGYVGSLEDLSNQEAGQVIQALNKSNSSGPK